MVSTLDIFRISATGRKSFPSSMALRWAAFRPVFSASSSMVIFCRVRRPASFCPSDCGELSFVFISHPCRRVYMFLVLLQHVAGYGKLNLIDGCCEVEGLPYDLTLADFVLGDLHSSVNCYHGEVFIDGDDGPGVGSSVVKLYHLKPGVVFFHLVKGVIL